MQDGSTTILKMLRDGTIFVPNYQRAYSWETPVENSKRRTQTDVFLNDIEEHINSETDIPFSFGHFIFEPSRKDENGYEKYAIVDGQQRLTTIIIFLSAIFDRLINKRGFLNEDERRKYRIIKDESIYPFTTVSYDNKLFIDYVINHRPIDKNNFDYASSRRIVEAYDFFIDKLLEFDENHLSELMETVLSAECTTHVLKCGGAEAIQQFIFQNDRGKHPSNLEVIKARFMHYVLLYADRNKSSIINELQGCFSEIYKHLSSLEHYIDEDQLLQTTLRVKYNTLRWINSKEKIDLELIQKNASGCDYILDLAHNLELTASFLTTFFQKDELQSIDIHSIRILGKYINLLPYIVKCYSYNTGINSINKLCSSYLHLALRDSIIRTRADLATRLDWHYSHFTKENPDIDAVIRNFEYLKNAPGWYSFWNNDQLKLYLQEGLNPKIVKFILWEYENYLRRGGKEGISKAGYKPIRYDEIELPELEHIAPRTPTSDHPENDGYDIYDEEFRNQYLNCIGNFLLISKSHNCSIGNETFDEKREDYKYLEQQREIQELTKDKPHIWNRVKIDKRKEDLIKFVLENF